MSTLKPGIYKATVRGMPDVLLVVSEEPDGVVAGGWTAVSVGSNYWHQLSEITDARPLIVLDLDDPADFVRILRGVGLPGKSDQPLSDGSFDHIINGSLSARRLSVIADQIEEQTKPPRIPEPGLWGVVEAGVEGQHARRKLGRVPDVDDQHWVDETDSWYRWSDLIDPVLIREGIA